MKKWKVTLSFVTPDIIKLDIEDMFRNCLVDELSAHELDNMIIEEVPLGPLPQPQL